MKHLVVLIRLLLIAYAAVTVTLVTGTAGTPEQQDHKSTHGTAAAAAAAAAALPVHSMRLGFNMGYITDSEYYTKAIHTVSSDGFNHLRCMGPFLRGIQEQAPFWTVQWIKQILIKMGGGNDNDNNTRPPSLTLTLSDYPYPIPPDVLHHPDKYLKVYPGQPSASKLLEESKYTNRGPPVAWQNGSMDGYRDILIKLRTYLAAVNIEHLVDFEIGNEPNAAGYFWGTAEDYTPIADITVGALLTNHSNKSATTTRATRAPQLTELTELTELSQSPISSPPSVSSVSGRSVSTIPPAPRVVCCAFSSELGGYNEPNGSDHGFHDFAQQASQRYRRDGGDVRLSWHFYRHSMNDANPNRSTYANVTRFYGRNALNGSVITEWGLFTYNSVRSTQTINSPELMVAFVQLLSFAYDVKLSELNAHCLMDNPKKGGHNCYFDRYGEPRESYDMYKLVQRVIYGGFRVQRTRPSFHDFSRAPMGGALTRDTDGINTTSNTTSIDGIDEHKIPRVSKESSSYGGWLTTVSGTSTSGLTIVCACGSDSDGTEMMDTVFQLPGQYGVVASSDFEYDGKNLPSGQWMVIQNETILYESWGRSAL